MSSFYAQAKGTLVAFIDKSYRAPAQALGRTSFYVLTAVLFPHRLEEVRAALEAIAESSRWHTTDEAQSSAGQERITLMAAEVAACGAVVVAIQNPIPATDRNADQARRRCFEVLLGDLCRTGSLDPLGLVVFEQRRDTSQRRWDEETIRTLRRQDKIPQTLYVTAASPAEETLLWAPDVAAWALRRNHTHDDTTFIEPIARSGSLFKLKALP